MLTVFKDGMKGYKCPGLSVCTVKVFLFSSSFFSLLSPIALLCYKDESFSVRVCVCVCFSTVRVMRSCDDGAVIVFVEQRASENCLFFKKKSKALTFL